MNVITISEGGVGASGISFHTAWLLKVVFATLLPSANIQNVYYILYRQFQEEMFL